MDLLTVIVIVFIALLILLSLAAILAYKLINVAVRWPKSRFRPTSPEASNRSVANDTEREGGPDKSIADKVLFWEQQDQINQELIPRVIRQSELLARHIRDHENLPELAARAVHAALAEARDEQRAQHKAAVAAAKTHLRNQLEPDLAAMEARLNASIETKWRTTGLRYRLAPVGIIAALALSSTALIVSIVI